ncbi:MAG: ribonuclease III [Pseudomonadota bacterium]|jgi:ribonuclease-3|nr:ribonuclease III [Pseudomonadota bacterium]MEC7685232.1 ribonuclease III [Pseudomonadota bacterium]|tara:strand:+ start:63 stop:749 length:687 start_codon:yes stop_codon:yes gene_type:complete
MSADLVQLQTTLAYQFKNSQLLKQALTHRSFGADNNERLEFLGDALLDLIVGESLFNQHPGADEGNLSRLRSSIVNKSALAGIGREWNLGEHMLLGAGELKSGGRSRDSILADTVEAVVAAVYLDGGLAACRKLVDAWTLEFVRNPEARQTKDAKTRLQEKMQASGHGLPDYQVLAIEGEAHAQSFLVECRVEGLERVHRGRGRSKRAAEQQAALETLKSLESALMSG